jgi:MerR family redox-sensitive transcriptional activator SoxR
MEQMTIGQVSAESGISASAIRFYESLGILPKPARKSGKRLYDDTVLQRLAVVRFYRTTGVSIRHIAKMFAADARSDRHAVVRERIAEIDSYIRQARTAKRRLNDLLTCRCDGDRRKCVVFR